MKLLNLLITTLVISAQIWSGNCEAEPVSCDQIVGHWEGAWEIMSDKGTITKNDVTMTTLSYNNIIIMNYIVSGEEVNFVGSCYRGRLNDVKSLMPNIDLSGMIIGKKIVMYGTQKNYDSVTQLTNSTKININLTKEDS